MNHIFQDDECLLLCLISAVFVDFLCILKLNLNWNFQNKYTKN